MTQRRYLFGFVFSIMLTFEAYSLVTNQMLAGTILMIALAGLALLQLVVQLIFFLHLGDERKPRWNLVTFLFMSMVVGILVIGTLWIMKNLDYNHVHAPSDTDIIMDEGVQPSP